MQKGTNARKAFITITDKNNSLSYKSNGYDFNLLMFITVTAAEKSNLRREAW